MRYYIVYDGRGPEDGLVLEVLGEFANIDAAKESARHCWEDHWIVIYSYRLEDNTLIDGREEFSGELT